MQRNNSNIISAFVWPFYGLIQSLKNWNQPWAMNVFWVVCIYLGAIQIYALYGNLQASGADGAQYVIRLQEMYNGNIQLADIFRNFQVEDQYMDLYQPVLTWLVSRFTDNGHILFAVFAIVFGFFYSRNMWFVLDRMPSKQLGWVYILIILFFITCPISNINGVRMWTALQVYVYALLPYLWGKDKSRIYWLVSVPFIHFSMLYVVVLAGLFVLIPDRVTSQQSSILYFIYGLFVASLFVNAVSLDSTAELLNEYSPDSYSDRISGYTNKAYSDSLKEQLGLNNWYVSASANISRWAYSSLLLLLLLISRKEIIKQPNVYRLYSFVLLLSTLANVASFLPSGGRFTTLARMFQIPLIIFVLIDLNKDNSYYKVSRVISFSLLIPLIFQFRIMMDFYGFPLVFGNFFTTFIYESNIPLIDFVKFLL